MRKQIFLLLYFLYGTIAFAGEIPYRFTHITSKDGLPHNYVFSIVQDKKGFIWIGTNNGLTRYDGYNFKIFRPDPDKKNSISKKPANLLYVDLKGNLWINYRGIGVDKMDLETEKFIFYIPNNLDKHSISGTQIRKFFEDKDSVLWLASEKGIDLYDNKTENFRHALPSYIGKNTIPSNNVHNIFKDIYNNIWFLSTNGIGRLPLNNNKVMSLGSILKDPKADLFSITSMLYDGNENLWFSTKSNGIYRYNIPSNTITNYLKDIPNIINMYLDASGNLYLYADSPNYSLIYMEKANLIKGLYKSYHAFNPPNSVSIVRFAEDKSGNVWLSSFQGLDMFNSQTGITKYRNDIFSPNSISGNETEYIFIDRTESLWVCVHRKGIDKADLKQKPFKWFLADPLIKDRGLAGNNVTAICVDKKKDIWIGCSGDGLTRYSPINNTFTQIPLKSYSKLNAYSFTSIFEDEKGFIWVGYYDNQLDRIDPNTLKVEHFSSAFSESNPYYFKGRGVRKIAGDKEGNLWFASMIGLIEYNINTGVFTYHSSLYEKNSEFNALCRVVFIDKEGTVWAGSNNGGLFKYDKKNHLFTHFLNNPKDTSSISSNTVYSIYEDANGKMLIGTSTGLNFFDKKKGTFSQIGRKQNIHHYSILSIIPDSADNYWMSTDNGLLKYDIHKSELEYYNENDGLLGEEFNTTSSFVSNNGEIFLGSPKGMVSFFPSHFKKNPYLSRPSVTNLRVFNKNISPGDSINKRIILDKQIWSTKEIVLSYKENDFTLEFSALHYAIPQKILYLYKLDGFNDNWISTDAKHHSASFTGLPPGNYIFRLKATNNDGIINNEADDVKLHITILPPFWNTLLFKIMAVLVIVSFVVFYIRYRVVRLRKQNLLLEKKVAERTSDLQEANMMLEEKQDEISLQKEELLTQRDTLEEAYKILKNQQNQIIEQNKELDKHRNELELLIVKRTHELEQALNKAEESDRLKSAFLANMSHEIRTPMNAILGFSVLLQNRETTEEEKSNFIKIIRTNGELLMVLINDIIDLSLIQSNQISLKYTDCNITNILNEINEIYSLEVKKKGLFLKLNTSKIDPGYKIKTDSYRLKQIISNLLTNAVKFTQNGGIEFGVLDVTGFITFYVKDSGLGIPPDAGVEIFERFTKIENDPKKVYGGTGLGLSICKSIVELLGGRIWYTSETNVGTTFCFTHPILEQTNINSFKEEKTAIINSIEIPDFHGKTILVAEDEEYNFRLLAYLLNKTNANIIWAKNGYEAIDFAEKNHLDIILMDIKMPLMGGREATRAIKKIKPGVPIIAQTAFAYKKEIDDILESGIDEYLIKPIAQDDLFRIIKKYL